MRQTWNHIRRWVGKFSEEGVEGFEVRKPELGKERRKRGR